MTNRDNEMTDAIIAGGKVIINGLAPKIKSNDRWITFLLIALIIMSSIECWSVTRFNNRITALSLQAEQTGKDVETLQRSHATIEYRQKVLKATPCGSCHWDSKLIINVPEWCDKHGGVK